MNRTRLARWTLPVLLLAGGGAVYAVLVATKPAPNAVPQESLGRLVRTFRATPATHRIAVRAFGTSRAADSWTAIAEVNGRITSLDATFEEGELVQAGTVLATIDDVDYKLAVESAESEIASREQQLKELAQTETHLEELVELRRRQVAYAEADLDRVRGLLDRNVGTQAEFDRVSSVFVDRQAALQDLENQLELIPIQQEAQEISIEAAQVRLQQARRDVGRCTIRLPMTALCISRKVETHQVTSTGQQIGEFLGLERAEVVAMIEPRRALALLATYGDLFGPIDLRSPNTALLEEIRRRIEQQGIPADVTWRAGEGQAQWRGRLARASATIDQHTRSIPLIIEVDDAFSAVQIGIKPALVPNMFVEVTIYGKSVSDVYVVPRDVIRDGSAYVVRAGKLVIVPVSVLALEEEAAVLDGGLNDGDQIVLPDLFPAASGMELRIEEVANPVSPRRELPPLTGP